MSNGQQYYPPNMPPQGGWGQPQQGYPPPPGHPQYGYPQPGGPSYPYTPAPASNSGKGKIVLIVLLVLLVIGGGIGGAVFFLKKSNNTAKSEIIKGDSYTVEIPQGMSQQDVQEDSSIPSELDFRLELRDQVSQGGVINIGHLAGELTGKSVAEVGDEVEQIYANNYERKKTGQVKQDSLTIDGHDATVVNLQFSDEISKGTTIFGRVHFIATDTDEVIYLSCDWNSKRTQAIKQACEDVIKSMKITG